MSPSQTRDPQSSTRDTSPPTSDRPGRFLQTHRNAVKSTAGMPRAILLGSSFAVAMGLFSWLGHRWDEKHGHAPWGVLTGVALGFLYGAYEVWKITRPSASVPSEESKGGGEGGEGRRSAEKGP